MRRLILPTLALSMLVGLGGCHEGVHSSHGHSHHGHDGDYTLSLNQGQKWETDEALRHAMHGIRELVESAGSAPLDAAGLSSGVEANIEYMVKHCKLDPEADNVLACDHRRDGREYRPAKRRREQGGSEPGTGTA
jgi:hypothetical protein